MAKRVAPPVRLGIVGVGWGASHARVAHALAPLARVQAICARRRERLEPLAREMLEAAERAGVCHFTGFTWRFAPPFATLRRLLEGARLGPVPFVDGHF